MRVSTLLIIFVFVSLVLLCLMGSAQAKSPRLGYKQQGIASHYANSLDGKKTASGECYRSSHATAAHRSLPFGTLIRVTNVESGAKTTVRINDRGPFHANRILDLSNHAARRLGFKDKGTIKVEYEVISLPKTKRL